MMPIIRWDLVAKAIKFYGMIGYEYLEAPWIVSEASLAATLPPGHEATRCQDGPLVGSAEQSFMHMMLEGTMPIGRFVAATPCFRDDVEDELHQRRFMKVELIEYFGPNGFLGTCPDQLNRVERMATHARNFYRGVGAADAVLVSTGDDTMDLELGRVELGSYGFRRLGPHSWVYGTGFADPRFSIAVAKHAHHNRG